MDDIGAAGVAFLCAKDFLSSVTIGSPVARDLGTDGIAGVCFAARLPAAFAIKELLRRDTLELFELGGLDGCSVLVLEVGEAACPVLVLASIEGAGFAMVLEVGEAAGLVRVLGLDGPGPLSVLEVGEAAGSVLVRVMSFPVVRSFPDTGIGAIGGSFRVASKTGSLWDSGWV